jgi:cysteine desulfurase
MDIYLDNAATTPVDDRVIETMIPYMKDVYGNPSSIHKHGRQTRAAIEKARRVFASKLNTSPAEIFFTSGGTESDNLAIFSCIHTYGLKHAITSRLEHHAVLHTLQELENRGQISLSYVQYDTLGNIDLMHLEELLSKNERSLVSLMHVNNEIGNITDINLVAAICKANNAFFHSDTVQSLSHYPIDLQQTEVDFISGSGHKFHGPKGAGFIYIKGKSKIKPLLYGGSQERNMRGGTENVAAIIGIAKAFEIAHESMLEDQKHIQQLKTRLIEGLQGNIPDVEFNGESSNPEKSSYTILSASLPSSDDNEMLLFNLDIQGISASGGSACTSGSVIGSHVLQALDVVPSRGHIRFSFSRNNTMAEVEYVIAELTKIFSKT